MSAAFSFVILCPARIVMSDAWIIQTYYEESSCTTYAGEMGNHNYVCTPQASGIYSKTSYTLSNDLYTVTVSYYSDSNCAIANGNPTFMQGTIACEQSGNYYLTTSTAMNAPTSFPEDGILSQLYTTVEACNDGSTYSLSQYNFMTYNSGVCFPYMNGKYASPTSCSSGYEGTALTGCINYESGTSAPNLDSCSPNSFYSTQTNYIGSDVVTCYSNGGGSSNSLSQGAIIAIAVVVPVVVIGCCLAVLCCAFAKKSSSGLLAADKTPASAPPAV